MFPLISDLTGLNAVGPRTSGEKTRVVYNQDIEVYLLPNPLSGSVLPKNGTTSLHAKRKGWVGMSSPSVITANLWLACEKRVILIEVRRCSLHTPNYTATNYSRLPRSLNDSFPRLNTYPDLLSSEVAVVHAIGIGPFSPWRGRSPGPGGLRCSG